MSGDAQSRKRKDKRKKREDSVEEDFFTPLKNSTDEVIHVQKDIVCGGNVVTKLIFFGLLASIGVMVGIILMEYRGSTDEETTSAVDSPWSVAFHDWIDQVTDIGHALLEGTSQEVDKKTAWYGVDQPSTVEEQENIQVIDEEMFPEAIEALRREAEKEKSIAKELKEEKLSENAEQEPELDSADESVSNIEETEGTNGDEVISTEIVLETTEVPSEVHEAVTEELIVTAVPVKTEASLPPSPPVTESKFIEKAPVEEESADEGSPLEEESPVEEEEDEDLEIDKQKFRDLLAKYGQETPESSDVEQSDDDIQRVDYSEGEESPAGGEDVAEEEVGSEDDLKEWTGIKKTDVQESDSEVEEEVEEEESEEEAPPPPPPQPTWKKGGQRDFDEDYANTFITNDEDWAIKEELDRADEEFNYEEFYF